MATNENNKTTVTLEDLSANIAEMQKMMLKQQQEIKDISSSVCSLKNDHSKLKRDTEESFRFIQSEFKNALGLLSNNAGERLQKLERRALRDELREEILSEMRDNYRLVSYTKSTKKGNDEGDGFFETVFSFGNPKRGGLF